MANLDMWRQELERWKPPWLRETPRTSVFEGVVMSTKHEWGIDYDVQNGGSLSDRDKGPDTWLCEMVLARFNGKRVRVTIEELDDSAD